jgi:hypothetical protein
VREGSVIDASRESELSDLWACGEDALDLCWRGVVVDDRERRDGLAQRGGSRENAVERTNFARVFDLQGFVEKGFDPDVDSPCDE